MTSGEMVIWFNFLSEIDVIFAWQEGWMIAWYVNTGRKVRTPTGIVLPDLVQPAKGRLGERNLIMIDSATENKPPQRGTLEISSSKSQLANIPYAYGI